MAKYNFCLPIVALLVGALVGTPTTGTSVIRVFREKIATTATVGSPENAGLELEAGAHHVYRRETTLKILKACEKHVEFLSKFLKAHNADVIRIENVCDANILRDGFIAKAEVTGKKRVVLDFTGEEMSFFSCLVKLVKLQPAVNKIDADVDLLELNDPNSQTALNLIFLRLITDYWSRKKTGVLRANNINGRTVVTLTGELASAVTTISTEYNRNKDTFDKDIEPTVNAIIPDVAAPLTCALG